MEFTKKEIESILSSLIPNLTKSSYQSLIRIATYVKKEDKEIILDSFGKSMNTFYILKGTVRGYIFNEKGVEKNIFLRTEGFFGGSIDTIFYNKPNKYTFESIGVTHLLVFNFKKFEDIAFADPNLTRSYVNALKEIISTLNYRVETMITMSAKDRYLDLLKRNPKFLQKTYSKHIANFLGITPVSFSRILKEIEGNEKSSLSD